MGQAARWGHFLSHVTVVCQTAGFTPRVVQETYNSEGIFGLIAADMGLTLHTKCADNYHRRGLTIRPLSGNDHRVPTAAAWTAARDSQALRHLIGFLQDWRAARPPEG